MCFRGIPIMESSYRKERGKYYKLSLFCVSYVYKCAYLSNNFYFKFMHRY